MVDTVHPGKIIQGMTGLTIIAGRRMAGRLRDSRHKPSLLMTGGTLCGCFLELAMDVALCAVKPFMRAGQGEPRRKMIKLDILSVCREDKQKYPE
jgi:hypothetical protein